MVLHRDKMQFWSFTCYEGNLILKKTFHTCLDLYNQGESRVCKHQSRRYMYAELSLRCGDWGFSPATMNVAPATFIGKQKKNRTKRNPQLFDSPPTCCWQLEILMTTLCMYYVRMSGFNTRLQNTFGNILYHICSAGLWLSSS